MNNIIKYIMFFPTAIIAVILSIVYGVAALLVNVCVYALLSIVYIPIKRKPYWLTSDIDEFATWIYEPFKWFWYPVMKLRIGGGDE